MKFINQLMFILFLLFNFSCADGPGDFYEGQLEVQMQIMTHDHDHSEDEHEDEWEVEHVTLYVAGIDLSDSGVNRAQTWDATSEIELTENLLPLFDFPAVANIEFSDVDLILAEGAPHEHENEEEDEEEHSDDLISFSLEAIQGSEPPCHLHLEIHELGLRVPVLLEQRFSVSADQNQNLNIQVDIEHLFEHLPLEALCSENDEVHLSKEETPDLYQEILEEFKEMFSADFVSSEDESADETGHDHGHSH